MNAKLNVMTEANPNSLDHTATQAPGPSGPDSASLVAFLNPTINAYRRLVPDSLAPTRANWGWDNRTAYVRVPQERGPASRVELRVGDGAQPVLRPTPARP